MKRDRQQQEILGEAVRNAFLKLDPRIQWKNPVMFIVFLGAILVAVLAVRAFMAGNTQEGWFDLHIDLWLWFTVLFANFAEAVAEGRGKAQAESLRKARKSLQAKKIKADGSFEIVGSEAIRKGGAAMGIVYQEGPSLARDLGLPLRTLYAVSNRIPAHYHRAEVPKRDGGVRVLRVPDPVLKDIQRRIARVLLSGMPVSPHATAYRYGAGVVENARRHVGRPELLKLDILHFFDSIRYIQVKEAAFPAEIYAEPLRILLSMLCYDRDVLPQGAPTSPWIANLVLRPFDEKLGAWCRARGVVYTRYCDDLAFSGTALDGVEERAEEGLRALGFRLNGAKRALCRDGQQKRVTGLVVNERVAVPACRRRRLRQELYFCRSRGVEEHLRAAGLAEGREQCLRRLLGQVDFWLQAQPDSQEAAEYRRWLLAEMRDKR